MWPDAFPNPLPSFHTRWGQPPPPAVRSCHPTDRHPPRQTVPSCRRVVWGSGFRFPPRPSAISPPPQVLLNSLDFSDARPGDAVTVSVYPHKSIHKYSMSHHIPCWQCLQMYTILLLQ